MTKRVFDVVVASLFLVLLSPVLLVVAGLVLATLGRPILFRQVRPGRYGEPFTILKFRTMRAPLRPGGELLDEQIRLTRLGRALRASSLDELPELINVLKGDMSLVGPRPLLTLYLPRYSERQRHRHDVRPGLTGWAQIHGRNAIDWDRKFDLDLYYVEHQSLWLDLRILVRTAWQVLSRRGINEDGQITASEFLGTTADSTP